MKYKTIIFDWSGTLSDDRIPVYEANMTILKRYNKNPLTLEQFLSQTLGTFHKFIKTFRINENPETLSRLYAETYEQITNNGITPILYTDVHYALNILRAEALNLSVLSSHPQKSLEREVEQYNVKEYFSLIKGDSRDKALDLITFSKSYNIEPSKIIYIGDMIQDIQAAKQVGIISAAVCTGYHSKEKLKKETPVLGVFNSLTEFMQSIL